MLNKILNKREFIELLKDLEYNNFPFLDIIPKDSIRFNCFCTIKDIGLPLIEKDFLEDKEKEEIEGFGGLIVYKYKGDWSHTIEIVDPTPGLGFSIFVICYNF